MRLFIAEKPSLARAIADVLPKPHKRGDGFIQCGDDQIVTWCIGHLLEQAEPDAYEPRYARWNLQDLPIIPEKWLLKPRSAVTKQLKTIDSFSNRQRKSFMPETLIEKGNCWWMRY